MTWLAWRQCRMQLLVAGVGLAAVAVYLLVSGFQLRDAYTADVAAGTNLSTLTTQYDFPYYLGSGLVLLVPGLIGVFWGAPLVSRELESGTHRLVWNQSITRTRWLTVKLVFVGAAAAATAGLLSLLVSWFAAPLDRINDNRFTPLLFSSRGIVPVAYASFAVALGACVGLLVRRGVPAMATTLAIFAAVQFLTPLAARPHLEPAARANVALTAASMQSASLIGFTNGTGPTAPFVADLTVPGAWTLSGTEQVRNSSDQAVTMSTEPCEHAGGAGAYQSCLAKADFHVTVSYQPADRYWTFQWYETAIFLALAAGLAGFTAWWLRRRLA
jgi:hypothetical protein